MLEVETGEEDNRDEYYGILDNDIDVDEAALVGTLDVQFSTG